MIKAEKQEAEKQRGKRRRNEGCLLFLCISASLLLCLFFLSSAQASQKPKEFSGKEITPIQAIKELDAIAEQYRVGKNLTEADLEFNRQLKQKILRGTFDLRELAKLALADQWSILSPREQDEFVALLTDLLEARSIFAKERVMEKGESHKAYSINYKGQDYSNKAKTDAMAKTTISLKTKKVKVALNYRLKKNAGNWKIYDVIMDDASLVSNYRYSFGNIIKKQGYPELVRRMKSKLEEFKAK